MMRRQDFIFRGIYMSWMISWRKFLHRHNGRCPKIKNAPQVCCLAARLGGLLYRFRCVDNKNPDSSPVSVIWERNYRDCIPQQRYTFCFNSLIIYRVSVPDTICLPHQSPATSVQRRLLSIKMAVFMDRVCKIQQLSTKRAVFVDGMWKCRDFGINDPIRWCNRDAKGKCKCWKSNTCILLGARYREIDKDIKRDALKVFEAMWFIRIYC